MLERRRFVVVGGFAGAVPGVLMEFVGAIGKPKREIFIPVPPIAEPVPEPSRAPEVDPAPAPAPEPAPARREPVPTGRTP